MLSDFVANFAYHLFLVHITSSYFTLLTSECYCTFTFCPPDLVNVKLSHHTAAEQVEAAAAS